MNTQKKAPPAWPKLHPLPHQLQQLRQRLLRQLCAAKDQRGGRFQREVHRLAALVVLELQGENVGFHRCDSNQWRFKMMILQQMEMLTILIKKSESNIGMSPTKKPTHVTKKTTMRDKKQHKYKQ